MGWVMGSDRGFLMDEYPSSTTTTIASVEAVPGGLDVKLANGLRYRIPMGTEREVHPKFHPDCYSEPEEEELAPKPLPGLRLCKWLPAMRSGDWRVGQVVRFGGNDARTAPGSVVEVRGDVVVIERWIPHVGVPPVSHTVVLRMGEPLNNNTRTYVELGSTP